MKINELSTEANKVLGQIAKPLNVSVAPACPNCWGNQEYGDRYLGPECLDTDAKARAAAASKGPKTFVMKFVETYVSGIRSLR